jgi:NDP-sugar pyrophosphorylase family protein
VDLKKFYEIGEESRAEATLLVSWRKTMRYLLFDKRHQLKGWTNLKTGEVRTPFEDLEINQVNLLAFSGIHLIKPSLFALLEEWPQRFPIMDFYLDTCSDHHYEGCEMEDLRLLDVGKLDSLEEAEKLLKLLKS